MLSRLSSIKCLVCRTFFFLLVLFLRKKEGTLSLSLALSRSQLVVEETYRAKKEKSSLRSIRPETIWILEVLSYTHTKHFSDNNCSYTMTNKYMLVSFTEELWGLERICWLVSFDDYGEWLFKCVISPEIKTTENDRISTEFKFTKWIWYCRRFEISFNMHFYFKLRSNRYLLASQWCFNSIIYLRSKKNVTPMVNISFLFFHQPIGEEEDDKPDRSFLAVTIISTIEIKKTHLDMHGLYQCVGVYKELYAQQTFHVNVITNGKFHLSLIDLFSSPSRNNLCSIKFRWRCNDNG